MSLSIAEVPKRQVPWLGIGVEGEWHNYKEALHDGQLDYNVISKPAKVEIEELNWYDDPGGSSYYEDVPGYKVNIVEDSNKILGCVSNAYGVIQNEDAFKLMQPLCDAGAVITHAGMTEQGLVFMVAEWGMFSSFGEEYRLDIFCTNSFNGNYPCGLIMTPTRIYCQNMYRKLVKDQLLHVRHFSLAQQRIAEANANQKRIIEYTQDFIRMLEHAFDVQLNQSKLDMLVAMIFPYPKDEKSARYEMSKVTIDSIREEWMDMYYCASDVKKFGASALRFIHAYYDFLSHGDMRRRAYGNYDQARLSRLISGELVNTVLIKEALR